MRRGLALGLALASLIPFPGRQGWAESGGAAGGPSRTPKVGTVATFSSRDPRAFAAQKAPYSRQSAPTSPVDKRSRAAVFAKGVRDYYPGARGNQSKNSNVVDPRTLCSPGRRALLQR